MIRPPINPQGQARFNVLPLYLDSSHVNGVVLGTVGSEIWLFSSEHADSTHRPRVEIVYRRL